MKKAVFRTILAAACCLAARAQLWELQKLTTQPADLDSLCEEITASAPECLERMRAGQAAVASRTNLPETPARPKPAARPPAAERPRPAPEKLTEFEQLAAASAGEAVAIFGSKLFQNVPATFAPVDQIPVTADYVLGPGDELQIRVWGQMNLNVDATIDRTGSLYLPQVGVVQMAGLEYRQAAEYLRSRIAKLFRNFDISVSMGQLRSIQIFVVGHVRQPGSYMVSSLSTLVNALFASGGPAAQGSLRAIQLKRGGKIAAELDLYDLLLEGDKSKDARLLPGDVIYVPPASPQIAVIGSVKQPAIYELDGPISLRKAVALAGGLSIPAGGQQARIERVSSHKSRQVLSAKLDDSGLETPLAAGDILRIESNLPRFLAAVTLRGNVANPGRYPWHHGMRLRDLIPEPEALLTRDYWRRQNKLGFVAPAEAAKAEPGGTVRTDPAPARDLASQEINWSYSVIERRDPETLATRLVPFHLGRLVRDRDHTQNLELQDGDVVTIFSQADFKVSLAEQNSFVTLEGEVKTAGVFGFHPGETVGDLLKRTGGLSAEAYLFGAQFLRESTRHEQQQRLDEMVDRLEQELEEFAAAQAASAISAEQAALSQRGIAEQRKTIEKLRRMRSAGRVVMNLEPGKPAGKLLGVRLENGDRLVVPSRPATVNVFGAVYSPNAFLHDSGLRVAEYLGQAGGLTRAADRKRAFVMRADGSVVNRSGMSQRSFDRLSLQPGDSIVVPEVLGKGGKLRGIRDWTQIVAQAGLGAAAINVLR